MKYVVLALLFFFPTATHALASGGSEKIYSKQLMSTEEVLDSIGVQCHMGRTAQQTAENAASMLGYVGIRFVRFDVAANAVAEAIKLNQSAGIKFNGLIGYITDEETYNAKRDLVLNNISIFDSVEGPNEIDISAWQPKWPYPDDFLSSAKYVQNRIYEDFKNTGLVIYGLTNSNVSKATQFSLTLYPLDADFAAYHAYPMYSSNRMPYNYMGYVSPYYLLSYMAGTKTVITEGGYYTIAEHGFSEAMPHGVSEETHAKYLLNSIFDSLLLGNRKYFIYELVDPQWDVDGASSEQHFGLFKPDMSPKKAADAIKNLKNILHYTGRVVDKPLSYTVSTTAQNLHYFAMQSSADEHFIAIWNEEPLFDIVTNSEIEETTTDVVVEFPSDKHVLIYDPILSSSAQTVTNAKTLSLQIPNHVVLLKVSQP